jgi:hypothetical protein
MVPSLKHHHQHHQHVCQQVKVKDKEAAESVPEDGQLKVAFDVAQLLRAHGEAVDVLHQQRVGQQLVPLDGDLDLSSSNRRTSSAIDDGHYDDDGDNAAHAYLGLCHELGLDRGQEGRVVQPIDVLPKGDAVQGPARDASGRLRACVHEEEGQVLAYCSS